MIILTDFPMQSRKSWTKFRFINTLKPIAQKLGQHIFPWGKITVNSSILGKYLYHLQSSTHVKISQLVASLQTSRQQVVFARLVTSCQKVWNKLLTTCNNLVDIVRLVTRLFQQDCCNHDITILLQPCVVNLVTFLLYHDCIRHVRTTLQQIW